MMTAKENYLTMLEGGKPDRFLKQYEAFGFVPYDPLVKADPRVLGKHIIDPWDVHIHWDVGEPGCTPYITDETKVCKDITQWQDYVKAPSVALPQEEWDKGLASIQKVDTKEKLLSGFCFVGLFERLHFLMGFEDALCNLLIEPESTHELLDYITDWKMQYLKELTDHLPVEVVLFHDDWGTKQQMFMQPDLWREFFKPRYEKMYRFLREKGIYVVHHSDSFCEPIVEDMAEIGMNVWQGVLPSNDIPAIQKRVGGKLILMGGIDSGIVDMPGASETDIRNEVARACQDYGVGGGFIPSITYGGPEAIHDGVYDIISDEIEKQSSLLF